LKQESLLVDRLPKASAFVAMNVVSCVALASFAAIAAEPAAAPTAQAGPALELNKLETYDKGCRAYIVVNNLTDVAYPAFKLDLVLFQTDGVIGRRFALDLAPVRAQKKTVKLFELDGVACDKIGSFLINDVMDCKIESGPAESCLQKLTTSTLTTVQLSK
jgi:hypothetical protein